jgi:hypothetical protein
MTKARQGQKKTAAQPGYDGAVEFTVPVHLSLTRRETRVVRARPGTFEWRYNRDDNNLTPLYHAGVKFADLMERAGAADARSPDLTATGGAGWRGLPDGRVAALDDLKVIMREVGNLSTSRLTTYCVRGQSVSEIASAFAVPSRDMAAVLHMDLRALAQHLNYL